MMTQSDTAPTQLELVSRIPLPVNSNVTYPFGAIPARGDSANIVFSIAAQYQNGSDYVVTLRFDEAKKTLDRLQGNIGRGQQDCDLGLASLSNDAKHTRVIDVRTGEVLSTFDAQISRVGVLGLEVLGPGSRSSDPLRMFDVRTGILQRKVARSPNAEGATEEYIGSPAWDDGNLRMFAAHRHDGERYRSGYVLWKMRGYTFDRGESGAIHNLDLGFDRLVGNPTKGPFAAEYSSNRHVSYTTFSQDIKETKFQADQVLDISSRGVLGRMITKRHEYSDPDMGPVGCWDPFTGKKLWQLHKDNRERAQWLDRCALLGEELRHPRTGKVLYRLPKDRTFIAAKGNKIWLLSNGPPRQFEVWRVR